MDNLKKVDKIDTCKLTLLIEERWSHLLCRVLKPPDFYTCFRIMIFHQNRLILIGII